ncbi:MAG TPA: IS110 family transposase [Pyrinomonadaceae bacterium]|nr:IS110 family transposase [Pyrinomonadaceae bacterium]
MELAADQDQRVQLLRTHHGIGLLTGLCLVHTLAAVERFANPRKVTAYVGFDPVEDSTGERHRIGSISKQGSRMLRMLLVEAGQVARRRDADLERRYRRLLICYVSPEGKWAFTIGACWCVLSSCCVMRLILLSFNDVASQPGLPVGARRLLMPVYLIGKPALLRLPVAAVARKRSKCQLILMGLKCSHR